MTTLTDQSYELVDIARLFPHPDNPRRGDVGAIAESLDAHGFYGAVVAQLSTGRVLAGNHRLLAARDRGLTQLPVVWVDVDDDEARRILLVDNRANDVAGYDHEVLTGLLSELAVTERALAGTGYDDDELARLLNHGWSRAYNTGIDDAPPPPKAPHTEPGDVWLCGPHRVHCGDATEAGSYAALLGDERADMVFTDPPYGVAIVGGSHALSPERRRAQGKHTILNDTFEGDGLHGFLTAAFTATLEATKPGALWYVTAPHGPTGYAFSRALTDLAVWKHSLVWVKDSLVLARSDYHYRHEAIYYGWTPGAKRLHQVTDRSEDTVWEVPRPKASKFHPTMKPVELIVRAILNSTDDHAIVLDPFGGSGSTLIAAEHHRRVARLLELDPKYVDVICRRWQDHTGMQPINAESGEPHDFTEEVSDG